MKNTMSITLNVLIYLWLYLSLTSSVNALDSVSTKPLDVKMSLSCETCILDRHVVIISSIENVGNEPVTIYGLLGWGALAGLTMHVADDKGRELQVESLADGLIVPSTLVNTSYYVTLFTNHALTLSSNANVNDIFAAPGKYTIWVSYRSPVPNRVSLIKKNFISFEDGAFASNKVEVVIKEK